MPPPPGPGTVCETEDQAAGLAQGSHARDWRAAGGHDVPGPGFQWMVLQRHGKRPLAVLGRTLLQANNRCVGLSCWSEIAIQETSGARFAACLRHTPPGQGDPVWRDAWLCDNADAVLAALRAHDPLQALPPPIPPDCAGAGAAALFAHDHFHHHVETARLFRAAWAGLLAAVFGLPDRAPLARSRLA